VLARGRRKNTVCLAYPRRYRNRAIVYTLIETGMRRAAITQLHVDQVDGRRKTRTVVEKGGSTHTYQISRQGAQAIQDSLTHERATDAARGPAPALFLAAATVPRGTGRLMGGGGNTIWNAVCRVAQVEGRTPPRARHAMGKHMMEKMRNIAAVQRQLGHRQAAYAMQYARVTTEDRAQVLDDREPPPFVPLWGGFSSGRIFLLKQIFPDTRSTAMPIPAETSVSVEYLTTARLGEKGQIPLPKAYRDAVALDTGAPLTILQVGSGLLLIPEAPRFRALCERLATTFAHHGTEAQDLLETLPAARQRVFARHDPQLAAPARPRPRRKRG
jgi:bifunctional DNA-binding transcriptional regulator/antitoxin component of YhaV-PrlF toxin-antitoxin module